jgi:hypothetical protein
LSEQDQRLKFAFFLVAPAVRYTTRFLYVVENRKKKKKVRQLCFWRESCPSFRAFLANFLASLFGACVYFGQVLGGDLLQLMWWKK